MIARHRDMDLDQPSMDRCRLQTPSHIAECLTASMGRWMRTKRPLKIDRSVPIRVLTGRECATGLLIGKNVVAAIEWKTERTT
ncbi:MAG TPA: hypothetical protein PKA37_11710, partial [Planctomycetota bacterium]|nr:hypothetical protein [Planctomycetota bacterium]